MLKNIKFKSHWTLKFAKIKKTTFILIALIFFELNVNAQDVILTTKTEIIKAKVTEIETTLIKYRKFENIDGPIYSILKEDGRFNY
jgi:hypothetical protein